VCPGNHDSTGHCERYCLFLWFRRRTVIGGKQNRTHTLTRAHAHTQSNLESLLNYFPCKKMYYHLLLGNTIRKHFPLSFYWTLKYTTQGVSYSSRISHSSLTSNTWKSPKTLACKFVALFTFLNDPILKCILGFSYLHIRISHSGVLTHFIRENEAFTGEYENSLDFLNHFLPFTPDNATLKTELMQKSKLKSSSVYTIIIYLYIFKCLTFNRKIALEPSMICTTANSIWQWKMLCWSVTAEKKHRL